MSGRDAWIHMLDESETDDALVDDYARLRDPATGQVDNILRIHSQRPATLQAHVLLYTTLMHGASGVTRADRELLAVVVSALNQCHY